MGRKNNKEKDMKKILAVLLATMMIATMAMSAIVYGEGTSGATTSGSGTTVTITVNRDSSYAGDTSGSGRAFTWYKIFTAVPAEDFKSSNASGHTNGVANVASGTGTVAYYATEKVAKALGAVTTDASGTTTWSTKEGNEWFDLIPIAGSDLFTVTWRDGVAVTAENMQKAAKWLIANNAYESKGSMTFADGKWTAEVEKGYYVLSSDTGDNVIAATTDITVNEKNDYPPIKKEQTDVSGTTYVGENGDPEDVAIGDVVYYKVTITIPSAAKDGETIEVWDKPSEGLKYNNDVVANPATGVADGTLGTGEVWHKVITVDGNQGTDVVFSYSMTITDEALFDTGRENEAGLKYGNTYESLPHSVKYKTYYTGIEKVDGDDSGTKLANVKFTLTADGKDFPVKKATDGNYYIPDSSGTSNEVVTGEDGLIVIRGLDKDVKYVLTETETNEGYNLLAEPKELTLVEDTSGTYVTNKFDKVENNKGTVLPSTGGIGTTIFYIVGGLLAVGAGVVLVTKKRMSKEDV